MSFVVTATTQHTFETIKGGATPDGSVFHYLPPQDTEDEIFLVLDIVPFVSVINVVVETFLKEKLPKKNVTKKKCK